MLECWEEFLPGPVRQLEARSRVSLTRKGELRLNMPALKSLGEPEAVVLLYDRLNSRIGIRSSNGEVEHAFPLHRSTAVSRARSARIYANPFCKYHGIRSDKTLVFADPKSGADGLLILDLKQTYETVN